MLNWIRYPIQSKFNINYRFSKVSSISKEYLRVSLIFTSNHTKLDSDSLNLFIINELDQHLTM